MSYQVTNEPPRYPVGHFMGDTVPAIYEVKDKIKAPDALIGMAALSAIAIACQGLIDVKLPYGRVSSTCYRL